MSSTATPLVSVIVPIYNAEGFIRRTAESILRQTFQNFEVLLVVDVRCNQATRLEVEKIASLDSRFRRLEGPLEGGVAGNRNSGIAAARGRYLAFLDADDLWMETKLERQVARMEASNLDFTYHSYRWIDEKENPLGVVRHASRPLRARNILAVNPIGCLTAMVRRQSLGEVRFQQTDNEDWLFWYHLLSRRNLEAVPIGDVLASYRIVAGSRSSRKWDVARSRWRHYRQSLGLGILSSLALFAQYALISLYVRRPRRTE